MLNHVYCIENDVGIRRYTNAYLVCELRNMAAWYSILFGTSMVLLLTCHTTMAFDITRRSRDKFTNPRCVSGACSNSSSPANCDGLNGAHCVTSRCFECQCNFNKPTFYQSNYWHGTCAKNEELLVSLSKCITQIMYKRKRQMNLDHLSEGQEVEVDKNICLEIHNIIGQLLFYVV